MLVSGNAPKDKKEFFETLNQRIADGSTAVFLTPEMLTEGEDKTLVWGPFDAGERPLCNHAQSWYFRCDHWAKKHALFDGLPSGGIMDYNFYRNILGGEVISNLRGPFEAVAGPLQLSGPDSAKFEADATLTIHPCHKGRFILNTLRVRQNIGKDPAADRLLKNFIREIH